MEKIFITDFRTDTRLDDLTARDLVNRVEHMPLEALHELPFGVIRLDPLGNVTFYSRTEAVQSGFGDRVAIGRAFFADLAPCLGTPEFLAEIERAAAEGTLDLTFEHIGDFEDAEREMTVRMASGKGGGLWLFLQRHGPVDGPELRPG